MGHMPASYDGLTFELLGHASVRIETEDATVLYIDPWSEKLDGEPGDADVVFVTHDDFDHFDPDAIEAVSGPDTTVAVYESIDTADLSLETITLPLEGTTTVDGIEVRSVPAYNDPDGDHVDENGDPYHAEGEVIGLLLSLDGTTAFYPSDTDVLPHHEELEVDVLLPPIGGHYTMNRTGAAEMARTLQPDLVLPVHYGTFEATQADVDAFVDECAEAGIDVDVF